jgi:hypothetical protein
MSIEDALFRAMRPAADSLLVKKLGAEALDYDQLAEQVLRQFREIIQMDDYAAGLKARLAAFLRERAAKRHLGRSV